MGCSVLIVEDDEILADNMRTYIKRQGWEPHLCDSAEQALARFEEIRPDVMLVDQGLPGLSGIELIKRALAIDAQLKAIMITGDGKVQCAVEAMKAGAYDYLTKPVVLAELKLLIEKAEGVQQMEKTLSFYQSREAQGAGLAAILGNSPPVQAMKSMVRSLLDAESRMASDDLPVVLINGETGAGKEGIARALHVDGVRKEGPFVEVNCASIPAHLLEAELFGHEKGAFTDAKDRRVGLVEAADGGTLFLDEIGEIDFTLQAKLLKLLEDRTIRRLGSVKERKVNLSIITATNRDLEQMVREGKFRSDLYFRLRIIAIKVPPLRARGDDILLLARHFLALHSRRYGKTGLAFAPESEAVLMSYSWPGNVRELRNMLEQTVLLASGRTVLPSHLVLCPGLTEVNREFGGRRANDRRANDRNGGDRNGGDRNGGDRNGGDRNGGDRSGGECNGGERNGNERSGGDCMPSEGSYSDRPHSEGVYSYGANPPERDAYVLAVPSRGGDSVDVERDEVLRVLDKTDWNVTKSARLLGITRDMLRYRIEKFGLERPCV